MIHDVNALPLPQLRAKGFKALIEALGVSDALRFLGLYHEGTDDYTKDRHQWLDHLTVDEIFQQMQDMKKKGLL